MYLIYDTIYIYGIPELAPKHWKGFIHPFSMVKSPPRALPFAENTIFHTHIRMFPKIGVEIPPKMHGENHGKAYEQIDDLGVFPYFWKHSNILIQNNLLKFCFF